MAKRFATSGSVRWNDVSKHPTCGRSPNRSPTAVIAEISLGRWSGANGIARFSDASTSASMRTGRR